MGGRAKAGGWPVSVGPGPDSVPKRFPSSTLEPYPLDYGARELEWLSSRDPIMGERIARVGHIRRMVDPDPFRALSLQVVGQQISNAALATVWSRVVARTAGLGGFSTDSVLALGQDGLASCGMSGRKASYVMGIATAVESGSCDLADLRDLPDADVISRLTTLRGVGTWTAEMFLIFSLGRLDVLAMDDLGIRNGMRRLYHHREVTPAIFERHRRRYSPYGTVASLYLWEAAQG